MRRAAKAEEVAFTCISASGALRDGGNSRFIEPLRNVALEIEAEMIRTIARHEEPDVARVGFDKFVAEFGADFVVGLTDTRSDGGGDSVSLRTERFHRDDRRIRDPAERAFPARMCRPDY